MGAQDEIKNIQQLNKEIANLYKQLGRSDRPPIFGNGEIQNAKDQIVGLNSQLGSVRESLDFIGRSFRDAFSELSNRNTELAKTKSALNGISNLTNKLLIEAEDIVSLDKKTIDNLEKQAKVKYRSLQISVDSGKLEKSAHEEAVSALETEKEFLKTTTQIRKEKEQINKSFGVKAFKGLEGITNAVPGLKQFAPAFQEASKAAQETAAYNLKNFSNTKGMSKLEKAKLKTDQIARKADLQALKTGKGLDAKRIKSLGLESKLIGKNGKLLTGTSAASMAKSKGLASSLKPLMKSMTPLMAGLKAIGPVISKAFGPLMIIMEIFKLDKQITDTAKGLNMTYKEAMDVNREMGQIAVNSENIFLTGKKINESFLSINKALGVSVKTMDKDLLVQFTEMREMAGFTNEELQGIAAITTSTGKEMDDVTGEFMTQAKLAGIKNGALLNEKDLLKGIGKVSAATTLSLGQNPGLIGKAVATAKSLGMELSKIDSISSGLLNFEASISAEMEAELLTGKELNLEKARTAALNNDMATVASEIAKQAGSAAEFGEMNRIKQEALAAAIGMNREELANTLFIQEQLKGLSGEAAKDAEALYNRRVADVGIAQAQAEMQKEGVEGLRNQVGMADRLTAAMDKVNEVFVALIEPLMPILDIFMGIFSILGPIMKLLNPFIQFAATGFSAIADVLTGLTGGGFGMENTKASVKRTEDASVAVFGKSADIYDRYDEDGELKMATGGIVTGPTKALVGEAGAEAVIPLTEFYKKFDELIAAVKSEGNVYLDSTKVGTAMSLSNYKMQ
mgnify:CR=1 FL=1